jgi:hypothetical protein
MIFCSFLLIIVIYLHIIVSATNQTGSDGDEVICQCGLPAKRYNC